MDNYADRARVDQLRDLSGRAFIVTGAGQGLGRAYFHAIAAARGHVVAVDIGGQNAERVAHEVPQSYGRTLALAVDIADEASVTSMAKRTHKEFGRLDGIVNNASIFSTLK